ncbi:hypothetical protein GCM10010915_27900 [Microbacterium faecale]|uniref:Uncharacterized protein n=1 Tax=Microbacterium faecale TaxID=1804630 RepID=A0A916YH03_9MICO|nr:hypothetical protein [Microbacterium faecale]GGD45065.1 hypothetical protein GCM10010915_27900 [Microbacterium faecale]
MKNIPDAPRRRRDIGSYGLLLGFVSAVFLLVPFIGDALAVVPSVGALVLAFMTISRHEVDRTVRVWPAIVGALLGVVVLFIVGSMLLVTTSFD